ncbi:MAG: hypothetical protein AAFV53_26205, partial [Myxococcota bacterium]
MSINAPGRRCGREDGSFGRGFGRREPHARLTHQSHPERQRRIGDVERVHRDRAQLDNGGTLSAELGAVTVDALYITDPALALRVGLMGQASMRLPP